jgi:hypothetical protein
MVDDWICAPFCRDGFMALDGGKGAWDDDAGLIDEGKLMNLSCFLFAEQGRLMMD